MKDKGNRDDIWQMTKSIEESVNHYVNDYLKGMESSLRANKVSDLMPHSDGNHSGAADGDELHHVFGQSSFRKEIKRVFGENSSSERSPFLSAGTKPSKMGWQEALGWYGVISGGLGIFFTGAQPVALIACISLLLLSIYGIFTGTKRKKLVRRYREFAAIIGERDQMSVYQLSLYVDESEEDVKRDLRRMKKAGYIPLVRFDENYDQIFLTDASYEAYQKQRSQEKRKEEESLERSPQEQEWMALLEEGESYIEALVITKGKILDSGMRSKLDRLETILTRIYDNVKKHPDFARDLRRMSKMYLPTVRKLIDSYLQLEQESMDLANVKETKREIENAMDTINDAFEHLLNDLFENLRMDLSSDISAMKTRMEQDGLRGDQIR